MIRVWFPFLGLALATASWASEGTASDGFADRGLLDTAASSSYALSGGVVRIAATTGTPLSTGDGDDGPCNVAAGTTDLSVASCAGRATADAGVYALAATASAGQRQLQLAGSVGLGAGDEVLVIALFGSSTGSTGLYETATIVSKSGNDLTLDGPLALTWDVSAHTVIVQRIPNYTSVAVASGATLTTQGWSGTSGGVLAFRALDAVTIVGRVHMDAKGYRGGRALTSSDHWSTCSACGGGMAGESRTTTNAAHSANPASGGGGGGDAEWCSVGRGGGGGGYGTSGSNGSTSSGACGGGWYYNDVLAAGGSAFGTADLGRLHLGPGGGGGGVDGDNPDPSTSGGNGGGIVWISTDSLIVTGTLSANGGAGGASGTDTGGGGGGAGGSILLQVGAATLGSGKVTATGGAGGTSPSSAGGAGGAGIVHIDQVGALTGTSVPAADVDVLTVAASARIQSANLLADAVSVGSVDTFEYDLVDLPDGAGATVRFSQDGTVWTNSQGSTTGPADVLAEGSHAISLAVLEWNGEAFRYRIDLVSSEDGSPVVDSIGVSYCYDLSETDSDGDDAFDVCDPDDDNDGNADGANNCPIVANEDQANLDSDGDGDACDPDIDGDDVPTAEDCDDLDPLLTDELTFHADADADGFGDADDPLDLCSLDAPDGYVADGTDNCPAVANPLQTDTDQNGDGNACDDDDDGDGVSDDTDNCGLVANADQEDTDTNGVGDACESDDDGNGVDAPADCDDQDPAYADVVTYYEDDDDDGIGDGDETEVCGPAPEGYVEADGDNCPSIANASQADEDDDGRGDACDAREGDDATGCACDASGPITAPWALLAVTATLARRRAGRTTLSAG